MLDTQMWHTFNFLFSSSHRHRDLPAGLHATSCKSHWWSYRGMALSTASQWFGNASNPFYWSTTRCMAVNILPLLYVGVHFWSVLLINVCVCAADFSINRSHNLIWSHIVNIYIDNSFYVSYIKLWIYCRGFFESTVSCVYMYQYVSAICLNIW